MPPSLPDDIRFDCDTADLCDDDSSSFATVRSTSAANESSDDYSIVDAESQSGSSAADHVPLIDALGTSIDERGAVLPGNVKDKTISGLDNLGSTEQVPELSHDNVLDAGSDEDSEGYLSSEEPEHFLPRLRSEVFEPITPPNFEPLAPANKAPEFDACGSLHGSHTGPPSSVWEADAKCSDVLTIDTPSLQDKGRSGLASPRLFDIEDAELKNDMLLTLRYLDSAVEPA